MYYLMNKNTVLATFEKLEDPLQTSYALRDRVHKLPIGFIDINTWLENRNASKHNAHIRRIMSRHNMTKAEGFIKLTHAAGINDTLWVKSDDENITWEQISLYKNEFSKIVKDFAFEGIGLYGDAFSATNPQFTTDGTFRKFFAKENDEIYIYKLGSERDSRIGLEPYCEHLASELMLEFIGNRYRDSVVHYQLDFYEEEPITKCKVFTNEEDGYVPYSKIMESNKPLQIREALRYFEEIGSGDLFRRMLIIDALTFNIDRHAGNFGVIINNDTFEIKKQAPIFDMNLSLLPQLTDAEFSEIGDKLLQYAPRLGDDFTRIAQLVMTDEIRSELENLRGFMFSFRGDDIFRACRVKALEYNINKHIDAILCREKLFTADVFIPEKKIQKQQFLKEKQKLADLFYDDYVEHKGNAGISITDSASVLIKTNELEPEESYTVLVDFLHDEITVEELGYRSRINETDLLKQLCANYAEIEDLIDSISFVLHQGDYCLDAIEEAGDDL